MKFSGDNRIVVDWDGTCVENVYPEHGEWIPGAVEALETFLSLGYEVVIYSTRLSKMSVDEKTPNPEWQATVDHIRRQLDEAALGEVRLWLEPWKPGGLFYVDDKAIEFKGDWDEVILRILQSREPVL